MEILPGTGAVKKTGKITKPQSQKIGSIFANQLVSWGGYLSASRLSNWTKELNELADDNNLFLIAGELYVPLFYEGETRVVVYNIIEWFLGETPCYELTEEEINQLNKIGIKIRS